MKTSNIEYHADDVRFLGYLAIDEQRPGRRPGILVAHEGFGLSEHAKDAARRLAEAGYVAFALDYHGDGNPLSDIGEVMSRIQAWMANPDGSLARARAALDVLTRQAHTDPTRIAGIGYCYGGTMMLDLARSGEDLRAVIGFHSALTTVRPAAPGAFKSKVLVQVGAEDPVIPAEQRLAFEREMTAAGADWRMIVYGGCGHSFTNPNGNPTGTAGFFYHELSDRRSWRAMIDLLDEALV